jgi:NAD+ diphosphatase
MYPRIDPAVIVLLTCGPFALLAHNAKWPQGRYSALAGFAEVGETLEQAAAREVHEEADLHVRPTCRS